MDLNASLRLRKLSQNPHVGIDNPTFLQDSHTPQQPALGSQHAQTVLGKNLAPPPNPRQCWVRTWFLPLTLDSVG